ncbi:hypothetical protein CDAR_195051 [Caerostris darwini]|uniref:Uncharacterized protein n=1 Tax=Caerostris darwini TaxID=1538125 RepID=A0AAV4X5L9_9ARAC|nr:hypothetical protein CDAR_195051 [Caerostris darwini]
MNVTEGINVFGMNVAESINVFGMNVTEGMNVFGMNVTEGMNVFGMNVTEGMKVFGMNVFGMNVFCINVTQGMNVFGMNVTEGMNVFGMNVTEGMNAFGMNNTEDMNVFGINVTEGEKPLINLRGSLTSLRCFQALAFSQSLTTGEIPKTNYLFDKFSKRALLCLSCRDSVAYKKDKREVPVSSKRLCCCRVSFLLENLKLTLLNPESQNKIKLEVLSRQC